MCAAEPGGGGEGAAGGWTGGEEASRPQEPERSPCPARQDQETEEGPKASDGCFGNPVFGELRGKSPSCKEAVPVPTSQTRNRGTEPKPCGFPSSHASSPRRAPCPGHRALEASMPKHDTPVGSLLLLGAQAP